MRARVAPATVRDALAAGEGSATGSLCSRPGSWARHIVLFPSDTFEVFERALDRVGADGPTD